MDNDEMPWIAKLESKQPDELCCLIEYYYRSIDRSSEFRLGLMVLFNLPMASADSQSDDVSKIPAYSSSPGNGEHMEG